MIQYLAIALGSLAVGFVGHDGIKKAINWLGIEKDFKSDESTTNPSQVVSSYMEGAFSVKDVNNTTLREALLALGLPLKPGNGVLGTELAFSPGPKPPKGVWSKTPGDGWVLDANGTGYWDYPLGENTNQSQHNPGFIPNDKGGSPVNPLQFIANGLDFEDDSECSCAVGSPCHCE